MVLRHYNIGFGHQTTVRIHVCIAFVNIQVYKIRMSYLRKPKSLKVLK